MKSVTLKTSSRRLEDVLENKECLLRSIFVYFSTSTFLCASPGTNFLVLTHCFHYCVASFNYGGSCSRDVGLAVDHSEQLTDSIPPVM